MLPVRQHVSIEVVVPLEGLAALRTDEAPLIRVGDHVLRQRALVAELLAALGADEWSLLRALAPSRRVVHHRSRRCLNSSIITSPSLS